MLCGTCGCAAGAVFETCSSLPHWPVLHMQEVLSCFFGRHVLVATCWVLLSEGIDMAQLAAK
jgi:hypothetical protein